MRRARPAPWVVRRAHRGSLRVSGIRFYRPISIGDLIEVDARMMRTDARSMQMSIHVRSGNPRGGRQNGDRHPRHGVLHGDGRGLAADCSTPVHAEDG